MNAPGEVRILGGELRGRSARVPPGARPSGGRLREALFSIWQDRLAGARILDLFAGSGAIAFEALSRGASRAVVAELSSQAVATLRRNAAALGLEARCEVIRIDLERELEKLESRLGDRFDLVFVDPPYGFAGWQRLLRVAARLLSASGELAAEHSTREEICERAGPLSRRIRKTYGESALTFYGLDAPDERSPTR